MSTEDTEHKDSGNVVTRAPNTVVVVCATLVAITLIGCITVLSAYSRNTDDLFRFLNLIFNAVTVLSGTGALLYAGAAAKQSHKAVQQTNGGLDKRIRDAVATVLEEKGDSRG